MRTIVILTWWMLSAIALAGDTVDVNVADVDELSAVLIGIGPAKAEKIIAFREAFGPIQTPEELLAVKGIGRKTLEKNRSRIITLLIKPQTATKQPVGLDDTPANH
jgi:competence protein ComEA helix-hairpin-helix repeat region